MGTFFNDLLNRLLALKGSFATSLLLNKVEFYTKAFSLNLQSLFRICFIRINLPIDSLLGQELNRKVWHFLCFLCLIINKVKNNFEIDNVSFDIGQ
jgi:hypothetical protein